MTRKSPAQSLESELRRQAFTFREALDLYAHARLTRRGLHTIVEASFATSYAAFEGFIEELFYAALLGRSGLPDAHPSVVFAGRVDAEAVLTMNRPFIKWLPWKDGIAAIAERVLVEGGPFARMSRSVDEKSLLNEARLLRNAVAHDSGAAVRAVEQYIASLPAGRRSVAGYLLSTNQGRTRYEIHNSNFRAVARCLTAPSVAEGHRVLLPERPFDVGDTVPRGKYTCVRGGHALVVTRTRERLGQCVHCANGGASKWRRQW